MTTNREEKTSDDLGLGGALFGCAFSAYLFYGAYCAFSGARWPAFMPPQLDVVALTFSLISEATSAYVAGACAGLLGAAILAAVLVLIIRGSKSTAATIAADASVTLSGSLPQSVETSATATPPQAEAFPLPTPVRLGMAARLRDGGSYMFVFEAAEGGLWTLMMQVIFDGNVPALGFQRPTLHRSDHSSVRTLEWDVAYRMLERIAGLEGAAAAGMAAPEMAACLAVARNEGRILDAGPSGSN